MANKGESLMSNEAWEELHTEPKLAMLFQVGLPEQPIGPPLPGLPLPIKGLSSIVYTFFVTLVP